MAKVMLFVDGTWLYSNTPALAEVYGKPNFQIDFGRLPRVLAQQLAQQADLGELDVVRTYLFGSYASNCDPRDDDPVQRRLDFFGMLKEEYHYEVEVFPINFRGRRLRRADRDVDDPFEPKEKCVDIALASSMLYFAALPNVYDIAIAVIGDQDFKPMLQHVRRLGKRVAIASIHSSCSPELADPRDEARVKDYDVLWLDDLALLQPLELKRDPHRLQCESPTHKGDRWVWTEFYPRKSQRFYCDLCRAEFARQKLDAQRDYRPVAVSEAHTLDERIQVGQMLIGRVTAKKSDRGFGFIRIASGHDFFFHLSDLQDLPFDGVQEGQELAFIVKRLPSASNAGAAQEVRLPGTNASGNGDGSASVDFTVDAAPPPIPETPAAE